MAETRERFAAVTTGFAALCADDPTNSAQLAVYHRGELVVDLAGGPGLTTDSLLPVFSSSKGGAGVVIGLLIERGQLDLDAPVAAYWAEFAQNGKSDISVRQLLSHQAGLIGVDGGYVLEEVLEHTALAERLAAQRPYWYPGQAFAYHALTIGLLADELVRRIDGRTLAEVLTQDVTHPRGIDVFLGTPEAQDHRVADVQFPTADEFMSFLSSPDAAVEPDAISSLSLPTGGALAILPRINEVDFRRAGAPAASMLASARGLATLYAAVRHDVGGPRLLSDDTVAQMSQTQVWGKELDTEFVTRFGVLFQMPVSPRWTWGSGLAFGHDGAGGSLAFADPTYDLAFGYTVQRMPLPPGVDPRAVELSRLVRSCVTG